MRTKKHFLILDTETTQTNLVADFGAIVVNRKGEILTQCAVLTAGIYNNAKDHPLFFTSDSDGIWSKKGKDKRYKNYDTMLNNGTRMLASVPAINRWLEKANAIYNPILTAYNLPFDLDKCRKTGIDLNIFSRSFCLWSATYSHLATKRKYKQFVIDNHLFNAPTELGNMTYKTNAETVARYLFGMELPNEPHTAIEDAIFYELPILQYLIRQRVDVFNVTPYNWRELQVKNHFKVKS